MEQVTNFAILFKDPNGIVEDWSVGAERIFGWPRDEMIGKSVEIIYTPEDRTNRISPLEMETAAANGVSADERWHLRKDGSLFYASGLLHAIYDGPDLTGYVKIVRDLTERVALEAQLAEARNLVEMSSRETTRLDTAYKTLSIEADRRQSDNILHSALVRRVMITQEDERKRISRDLHDHLGQKLTALRLRMEIMSHELEEQPELKQKFLQVQEMAKEIDAEVDFLAWELRPAAIDELGLEVTLQNFIDEWSRLSNVDADFVAKRTSSRRLAAPAEINLYRIAQEALNNILKFAQASRVQVALADDDGWVELIVEDDGVGFDPPRQVDGPRGLGLIGMGERAAILQGELKIDSASGKGTVVCARVPAIYQEDEAAAN
jgi:PAS domain S-box-containing protein